MTKGKMYSYEGNESLEFIIEFLIKFYEITNIKHVLVNNKLINDEILINNVKIKPNSGVLKNHFWFIEENT